MTVELKVVAIDKPIVVIYLAFEECEYYYNEFLKHVFSNNDVKKIIYSFSLYHNFFFLFVSI